MLNKQHQESTIVDACYIQSAANITSINVYLYYAMWVWLKGIRCRRGTLPKHLCNSKKEHLVLLWVIMTKTKLVRLQGLFHHPWHMHATILKWREKGKTKIMTWKQQQQVSLHCELHHNSGFSAKGWQLNFNVLPTTQCHLRMRGSPQDERVMWGWGASFLYPW